MRRHKEAFEFRESAGNEDKHLIGLYLPLLRPESIPNTLSQSSTECQWTPPENLKKEHAAHIIALHIFKKFRNVPFTEIVKAACGSWSETIGELYACVRVIYHWYQSSKGLRDEYARLKKVGRIYRSLVRYWY